MKKTALICWSVAAFAALIGTAAQAQSLYPMRQKVTSYSNTFSLQVHPTNPYSQRVKMDMKVYDQNFRRIPARISPKSMTLAAGASRAVTITVPFQGKKSKKIRICAETIPFTNSETVIKARVCGKFLATRK